MLIYRCQVIGRQIVPVKICSCPKRDKEKEEVDALANQTGNTGKRRMSASDKQELAKKIKLENSLPLVVSLELFKKSVSLELGMGRFQISLVPVKHEPLVPVSILVPILEKKN